MCSKRKGTCGHSKKVAICKPTRGASGEASPRHLDLGLPASRTGNSTFLSLRPPCLWHVVTAALGDGSNASETAFTKADSGGLSALKKPVEVLDHIFWARRWGPKWGTRHTFSAGVEVTLSGRQSAKAQIHSQADSR